MFLKPLLLFLAYLSNCSGAHFKCPSDEDLGGCECVDSEQSLTCNGVNLPTFDDFTTKFHFKTIKIVNSPANDIPFKRITTDRLILEDNDNLFVTNDDIHRLGAKYLKIKNNAKIDSKTILSKGFEDLQELDIADQDLGQLRSFGNFRNLVKLYLKNNQITLLGERLFYGLARISEIHLENNLIETLEVNSLLIDSDISLHLSNNKIDEYNIARGLRDANFHSYKYNIDLSSNSISSLSESIFGKLASRYYSYPKIDLDNNPIDCVCRDVYWAIDAYWVAQHFSNVKCVNYNDKDLFQMRRSDFRGYCPPTYPPTKGTTWPTKGTTWPTKGTTWPTKGTTWPTKGTTWPPTR